MNRFKLTFRETHSLKRSFRKKQIVNEDIFMMFYKVGGVFLFRTTVRLNQKSTEDESNAVKRPHDVCLQGTDRYCPWNIFKGMSKIFQDQLFFQKNFQKMNAF